MVEICEYQYSAHCAELTLIVHGVPTIAWAEAPLPFRQSYCEILFLSSLQLELTDAKDLWCCCKMVRLGLTTCFDLKLSVKLAYLVMYLLSFHPTSITAKYLEWEFERFLCRSPVHPRPKRFATFVSIEQGRTLVEMIKICILSWKVFLCFENNLLYINICRF